MPKNPTVDVATLQSRVSSLLARVREYSTPRRITDLASRLSFFSNEVLFATGVSSVAFGVFTLALRFSEILDKYTTAAILAPLVVLSTSAWSVITYRYRSGRPAGSVERGIYVLEEEIRKAESNPRTPPEVIKHLYSMKVEGITHLASEWQRAESNLRLRIKGE
jgi:hypothetical protein